MPGMTASSRIRSGCWVRAISSARGAVQREQHLVLVLQGGVQDLDVFHRVVDHQDAAVDGHVVPAHASSSMSSKAPAARAPGAPPSRSFRVATASASGCTAVSGAGASAGRSGVELRHGFHVVIL
jgi:hypothetical protein